MTVTNTVNALSPSPRRARYWLSVTMLATAPVVQAADKVDEHIELAPVTVTMTRSPTAPELVPASISTITGEELRARGVDDLRTALSLTAGVRIAPGGDAGPFGAVPGLRGLTEGDDYLLVVDGIPVGGAFNPATQTLDLHDIEKIEVLRGASPVLFGAISFVGVIHVSHYAAGAAEGRVTAFGGSRGSFGVSGSKALLAGGGDALALSVSGEVERAGLAGDADGRRAYGLLRAARTLGGGRWTADLDLTEQKAHPASPALFEIEDEDMGEAEAEAEAITPLDANYHFSDAFIKDSRQQLASSYTRPTGYGELGLTAALTHSRTGILRGFIEEIEADEGEVELEGFRQQRRTVDGYFDAHLNSKLSQTVSLTSGIDVLYGDARQDSDLLEYDIEGDEPRPSSQRFTPDQTTRLKVMRTYTGAYAQARWALAEGWSLLAGGRINHTHERRQVSETEDGATEENTSTRSSTRFSGLLGLNQRLWSDGDGRDAMYGYVSYRNTFKPADVDFAAEAEAEILTPQTGQSIEAGLKGRGLDGNRFTWYADVYANKVKNVVVEDEAAGTLTSAGEERFYGAEVDARLKLVQSLTLAAEYSYTNARYRDYVVGGAQQRGQRVQLTPLHEASVGVIFAPPQGLYGSLVSRLTGPRFIDLENEGRLERYVVVDASLGYRLRPFDLELVASNLGDRRDPVSISEGGEGQFYRLPTRRLLLRLNMAL